MNPAHEKIISAISDFYKFISTLPHIDPASLLYPPGYGDDEKQQGNSVDLAQGWSRINTEELRKRGKTDEVISLLRNLPYLRSLSSGTGNKRWMLGPDTLSIAYCDGEMYNEELDKIQPTPGHCIWLADPADSEEGAALLLDIENGTMTEYSVRTNRSIGITLDEYKTLPIKDRWMAHYTWPVATFFGTWRRKFELLEWMPAPLNMKRDGGTPIWFISSKRNSEPLDDLETDSEESDDSYVPSEESDEDDDYDDDDDYEDDDDDLEWDSEYESDISTNNDDIQTKTRALTLQDDPGTQDHVSAWSRDIEFQVRTGNGELLGLDDPDFDPGKAVAEAYKIYIQSGWPDSFNREVCQSRLSSLVQQMATSS